MRQTVGISSEFERRILEEAIESPPAAMMRLSIEIDRQLRLILAVIGRLPMYQGQSPVEAMDLIAPCLPNNTVPAELRETLNGFWDLRNRIIHDYRLSQNLAMRSLDYGLRILRMLVAIPRPRFVVFSVIGLFADADGRIPRPDVRGVILEHHGAKGEDFGKHVHPSRRDYIPGQEVSWEWDLNGPGWDETWYDDPVTGQFKLAFSESLEYVGRPLEQI